MKKNLISVKGWIAPIVIYLFMLLITCGAASVVPMENWGGRYLAGVFAELAGMNALVAHLLAGTALFAVFAGMLCLSGRKGSRNVWLTGLLAVALPTAVYSQSYGSLNGAVTVVPAVALGLFYMVLVEKLLDEPKKQASYALPLFLMGLATPLFHEVPGLGLCILSVGMTVKYWKRGLWTLLLHSLVVCGGTIFALLSSDNVLLFSNVLSQAGAVVDNVLAGNWPMLILLTAACLLLIQPLRAERSKRCNQILRDLLVPVAVFALCPYLKTVAPFAAIVKILFAVVYAVGVRKTIHVYVHREARRHRLYRLLLATVAVALPLVLMDGQNDGLMLLPCLLLGAATLLLWGYAVQHFANLERFCRKLAPVVGILALSCCVWIAACNGLTDEARREYSRNQEALGATEVCLPEYPFADYRAEEAAALEGVTVEYCPWEEWDWESYFAAHRSADTDDGEEYENPVPTITKEEEE